MNLEKFGQNFGQKVKWLIFDQMSRVGSRDRHAGWRSNEYSNSVKRNSWNFGQKGLWLKEHNSEKVICT